MGDELEVGNVSEEGFNIHAFFLLVDCSSLLGFL